MVRWIGSRVLLAAAAGAAAWAAWPTGDAMVRADVIATVLLLAGLPLLARWLLGPPDNRAARRLRACCYAAVLALIPAKAAIELFLGAVPRGGIDLHTYDVFQCGHTGTNPQCHWTPGISLGGPTVLSEVMLLFLTACGLAVTLALTARRTRVAPATLAIGAGAGLALGVVMYALAPLGFNPKFPDRPWLHGSAAGPLTAVLWIVLVGAPLAAGFVAGLCCHVPDDAGQADNARAWQGLAAGLVSGGVGAVFVTVLGAGTTALLVKSAWVRGVLYHGQHLTASAVYGRELFASQDVGGYFLLLVGFPIVGLAMALTGAGIACACRLAEGGTQYAAELGKLATSASQPEPGAAGGPPGQMLHGAMELRAPEPILTWWGGNRRMKPTE